MVTESPTDDELVAQARQAVSGDFRAFEALIERHQSRVMANCRYLTGSVHDAEDLTQEVFVKAYFALASFEGRAQFKTWVQRIKVNHCLNFIKKKKGKTFVDVDEVPEHVSEELSVHSKAEARAEALDQRQAIREVLESMPDTLRIPLIMRDLDGMSYQEIADSLNLGLSATKMRIKRAREDFRARYGPRAPVSMS